MTLSTRLAAINSAIRSRIGSFAKLFDLRDAFWITGLAAVTYGTAQIYQPAAWILCGAVLFWMGIKS